MFEKGRAAPRWSRGLVVVVCCAWSAPIWGATHTVPADWATIQAAIDAAANGDTVLVAPGVYDENIDFLGKAIVVESQAGPETTIIDGGMRGTVVQLGAGDLEGAALRGFTIQNGVRGIVVGLWAPTISGNVIRHNRTKSSGGGIYISRGSPRILDNEIIENQSTGGSGINVLDGAAEIRRNLFARNGPNPLTIGGSGGGIRVSGARDAVIAENVFEDNTHYSGGAIAFWGGDPTVRENVMRGNHGIAAAGAMSFANGSDSLIANNLVVDNTAGQRGGAVEWVSGLAEGPRFVNNTFAGNDAPLGATLLIQGYKLGRVFINNVITDAGETSPVFCKSTTGSDFAFFAFNDVFSSSGLPPYDGECPDLTGSRANLSVDPSFVDAGLGDFRLRAGSAVIDVGDSEQEGLPVLDFESKPRVLDGDGDGVEVVDLGAFEFETSAVDVEIDIRPFNRFNVVWQSGWGVIPVLLFGSEEVDSSKVDPASLTFGPGAATVSFLPGGVAFDFDRDGFSDRLFFFRVADSGLEVGDTSACLAGQTLDGLAFEGCDRVRVRAPRRH